MRFRTEYEPVRSPWTIKRTDPVTLIGSCFTDNIGGRLHDDFYDVTVNPTGILFNPMSIADTVDDLLDLREVSATELVEREGRWHSWRFHSRFSSADRVEAVRLMNEGVRNGHDSLTGSRIVIFTWGNAVTYSREGVGVVANCHKFPNNEFATRMLEVDEIVNRYTTLCNRLINRYDMKIIVTVSPVRHAYSMTENMLGKATLIEAAHKLVDYQPDAIAYFPSFEIMLDDLRDYRFYAPDMKHPSEVAVDYIYEKFSETYTYDSPREVDQLLSKLHKRLCHTAIGDSNGSLPTDIAQIVERVASLYPAIVPMIHNRLIQYGLHC